MDPDTEDHSSWLTYIAKGDFPHPSNDSVCNHFNFQTDDLCENSSRWAKLTHPLMIASHCVIVLINIIIAGRKQAICVEDAANGEEVSAFPQGAANTGHHGEGFRSRTGFRSGYGREG